MFRNRPTCLQFAMLGHLEHRGLLMRIERLEPPRERILKTRVASMPKTARKPASPRMRVDMRLCPWLATFAIEHQHSLAKAVESQKVCQFILDDFNGFKNLIFVSSAGNNHLSASENQTDNLRIVKSINQTRELFWLIFDFIER